MRSQSLRVMPPQSFFGDPRRRSMQISQWTNLMEVALVIIEIRSVDFQRNGRKSRESHGIRCGTGSCRFVPDIRKHPVHDAEVFFSLSGGHDERRTDADDFAGEGAE